MKIIFFQFVLIHFKSKPVHSHQMNLQPCHSQGTMKEQQQAMRAVMWAVLTSSGLTKKQPTMPLTMAHCTVTLLGIQWSKQMKQSGENKTISLVLLICISQKTLCSRQNDEVDLNIHSKIFFLLLLFHRNIPNQICIY